MDRTRSAFLCLTFFSYGALHKNAGQMVSQNLEIGCPLLDTSPSWTSTVTCDGSMQNTGAAGAFSILAEHDLRRLAAARMMQQVRSNAAGLFMLGCRP